MGVRQREPNFDRNDKGSPGSRATTRPDADVRNASTRYGFRNDAPFCISF